MENPTITTHTVPYHNSDEDLEPESSPEEETSNKPKSTDETESTNETESSNETASSNKQESRLDTALYYNYQDLRRVAISISEEHVRSLELYSSELQMEQYLHKIIEKNCLLNENEKVQFDFFIELIRQTEIKKVDFAQLYKPDEVISEKVLSEEVLSESSPVAQPNAGETDEDSVNVEKQDSPPLLVSVTLKLLRFLK